MTLVSRSTRQNADFTFTFFHNNLPLSPPPSHIPPLPPHPSLILPYSRIVMCTINRFLSSTAGKFLTLYDNKSKLKIFMSSFITRWRKNSHRDRLWLFTIYPQNSGNFGQHVNDATVLARPDRKIFEIKGMSAKGSPKFPTELFQWKRKFFTVILELCSGLTVLVLVARFSKW